jgi:hypothetical protein|tara:strand:- start:951 stop:1217 length:267 start_codon:yes stop_codon:yes gene_type:complete
MVIENYRFYGVNYVTSLTHWWRVEVYTITDYKKYVLCEHIKEFSSWYGPKRRYNHTKHSLKKLESVLDEVEQENRRQQFLELDTNYPR